MLFVAQLVIIKIKNMDKNINRFFMDINYNKKGVGFDAFFINFTK